MYIDFRISLMKRKIYSESTYIYPAVNHNNEIRSFLLYHKFHSLFSFRAETSRNYYALSSTYTRGDYSLSQFNFSFHMAFSHNLTGSSLYVPLLLLPVSLLLTFGNHTFETKKHPLRLHSHKVEFIVGGRSLLRLKEFYSDDRS